VTNLEMEIKIVSGIDTTSRSWFCVFNNPAEHGYIGSPNQITDKIVETWIRDNPQRTCAVAFCISADGLNHCHAVFEDKMPIRFSAIKKLFPSMHIEPTKGNKQQAEDYINKRGSFKEMGEEIICISRHGEIKANQGARNDLAVIEELLKKGLTPDEILAISIVYRKYEKIIRDHYYMMRKNKTPIENEKTVYWHVGHSGTGKSYTSVKLAEQYGKEQLYIVADYEKGFDKYSGEKVLFMDEFRGQIKYATLLSIIGKLTVQIHARYSNIYNLWDEVHITSVQPPESVYHKLIGNDTYDTYQQLRRRIDFIVYHYKKDNEFCEYVAPMSEYIDYATLRAKVNHEQGLVSDGFIDVTDTVKVDF